jgi:hypothetical protein
MASYYLHSVHIACVIIYYLSSALFFRSLVACYFFFFVFFFVFDFLMLFSPHCSRTYHGLWYFASMWLLVLLMADIADSVAEA